MTTKFIVRVSAVNEYTEEVKNITLRNVVGFEAIDDIGNITNTINISIPAVGTYTDKGDIIIKSFNKNNTESLYRIKKGSKISVEGGYNSNLYKIFNGFMVSFLKADSLITLNCENEMYELKRSKTLQDSFPTPVIEDSFKHSKYFVGQEFTLPHLVWWLFYEAYGYAPYKIYVSDMSIGKLRMNNRFTVSEVLDIMKERFGIHVYFRNMVTDRNNGNVTEPVLFVGWKYQQNRVAVPIHKYLPSSPNEITAASINFLSETIDINAIRGKFMYPYREQYKATHSRVIENGMEYMETGKSQLIVSVKSVQEDNSVITVTYPENLNEFKIGSVLSRLGDDATNEDIQTQIDEVEREVENYDDFIALESEAQNVIQINIPNLSYLSCKQIAERRYKQVEDDGFNGSLTVFGSQPLCPFMQVGDAFEIIMDTSNIRNLNNFTTYNYYIDKVIRTFTVDNGYKQIIYSGARFYNEEIVTNTSLIIE